MLYTTHYMEEAESLCDRLAVIDHGRIIALGTLAELRAMMAERTRCGWPGASTRRRRDPLSLALWVAIPLVMGLLLSLAFGRDEGTLRARLLVADRDGSLLSRLLVGAFGQGRLAELVEVEATDEGAAGARAWRRATPRPCS